VVFDVDGTLLDSAEGIVSCYQQALAEVGFPAPSEDVLRSDLGPPVGQLFTTLGLDDRDLEAAVAAYRRHYRATGIHQAAAYPGVPELLDDLTAAGLVLGTATAKLTTVARDFLDLHDLGRRFAVVNGTDETHHTKTETLTRTLELLGDPDPARVVMVGDRHSDITAGQACGVFSVGVTWGYGPVEELRAAGADALVHSPAELLEALRGR
jgi:phosphoglycolate phosphatase